MTRHQKRLSAPTSWPVERKTNVFTVKAGAGPHGEAGVPLLILLRDVLGYVENAREADFALNEGTVLVNGKAVSDPDRPIGMFDIIVFTEREEYYRVFPDEGGRLSLTPIEPDAADSKLGKIVGKRQVPGGATQLSLHDGRTLLVDDVGTYATSDSIVVDNEDGSIVAHFPYEEGALVTAVDGQHAGEIGTIETIRITPGSGPNIVRASTDNGGFETISQYVVVIDENFTGGEVEVEEPEPVVEIEAEPVEEEVEEEPVEEEVEEEPAEEEIEEEPAEEDIEEEPVEEEVEEEPVEEDVEEEPAEEEIEEEPAEEEIEEEPAEEDVEEEPAEEDVEEEPAEEDVEEEPAEEEIEEEPAEEEPVGPEEIEDIPGVGPAKAESLREAGFDSVDAIRDATEDELSEVSGIGPALAAQIKAAVEGGEDA